MDSNGPLVEDMMGQQAILTAPAEASFGARIGGTLRLRGSAYREVAAHRSATGQAALIVVLASISGGVSSIGDDGIAGLAGGAVSALIGWIVSTVFVYIAGDKLIPAKTTNATLGGALRGLGFASVPMLFAALSAVSGIGGLVAFVVWIWAFLAKLVAIRSVFAMGTIRALFVSMLASVVGFFITLVIAAMLGLTIFGIAAIF